MGKSRKNAVGAHCKSIEMRRIFGCGLILHAIGRQIVMAHCQRNQIVFNYTHAHTISHRTKSINKGSPNRKTEINITKFIRPLFDINKQATEIIHEYVEG